MEKLVLIEGEKTTVFESYKDLFQNLSERSFFVSSIEDGKIKTLSGEEFVFAKLSVEGTSEVFSKEVSDYRMELGEYVTKLKKQGINIPAEEMDRLKKQFSFLKAKKEA